MSDQDRPAWPTADDDRAAAGSPQVDPDKSKPGEQRTTPMPMPEPGRAVPMRIEPGKPPRPAQLNSDPPGGATTWFESPGEPPRAMPMRIEPTGKPNKAAEDPKLPSAKEKEPVEVPVDREPSEAPAAATPVADADAADAEADPVTAEDSEPETTDAEQAGAGEEPSAESTAQELTVAEDSDEQQEPGEPEEAAEESEPVSTESDPEAEEPEPADEQTAAPVAEAAEEAEKPEAASAEAVAEDRDESGVAGEQAVEEVGEPEVAPVEPEAEAPEPADEQTAAPVAEGVEEAGEPEAASAEAVAEARDESDVADEQAVAEAAPAEPVAEQRDEPDLAGEQTVAEGVEEAGEPEAAPVEPVAEARDESSEAVEEAEAAPAEAVAEEPAAATVQVQHVEEASDEPADQDAEAVTQPVDEPAPAASTETVAASGPEPVEEGPEPESAVERTVRVAPVAKPGESAPSRSDTAAEAEPEPEPGRGAPAGFGGLSRSAQPSVDETQPVSREEPEALSRPAAQTEPEPEEQPAAASVDETRPVTRKEPEGQDLWAERQVAEPAADVRETQPVTREEPEGPSKPAAPAEPKAAEPVGEKTVQMRPVQKPGEKSRPGDPKPAVGADKTMQVRPVEPNDPWFSVPSRSQPVAPQNRQDAPPRTQPKPPPNRPVGEKTTQMRPDGPTRGLPTPPPARPRTPPSLEKSGQPPFSGPTRGQPKRPDALGESSTRSQPVSPPRRPDALGEPPTRIQPKRPDALGESPTRNQPRRPDALGEPPTRSQPMPPPKRPELPTRNLPMPPPARPKSPMGLETSGQASFAPPKIEAPKPPAEDSGQPPPSNEDTQRSLPPLPGKKKRPKVLLVLAAVVVVIALGAGVVFFVPGVKDSLGFGGSEAAAIAPPPAPIAFTPNFKAPSAQAPQPSPQGMQSTLAGPAGNPALGTLTGTVIDAATGNVLWEKSPATPLTPASTTKVLTAAAALLKIPHSQQFSTKVVAGKDPGTVIIVGGGDGTLNSLPAGKNSVFPGSPRLDDLVAQVKAKGPVTQVFFDRSRYADDGLAPGVLPGDVVEGYISPISPLMMDGARADPAKDRSPRSPAPARSVAETFAKRIGATVAAKPEVTAPADAQVLGEVKSVPLTELVDQFLQASDNVLADVIAREVAKAAGEEASFAGTHKATLKVLSENGFDVTGAELFDGSGMSTSNKTPARLLAQVLAVAAKDGKDPRTVKLRPLLGGLPVAGGSGTLAGRFADGQAAVGRGWVRAKTGTLPLAQINSLAGVVLDADGRVLVFAFMTSQSDTLAARPALDTVAAALRSCGCK